MPASWSRCSVWFALLLAVTAGRTALHLRFRRARNDGGQASAWKRRFVFGALASGALWALGVSVFFPYQDPLRQMARQGGDEFAVVLSDVQSEADCRVVADKILRGLEKDFRVESESFSIGASMGISLFPADAGDGDALLRNADAAMYRAKQLGRNRYCFHRR